MNYSPAAMPLLASPQGVAASSIRYCEATEAAAAGVVFLLVFDRKTTPASRSAEASRYFVTRSATPPCGDARRGICSIPICSHLHRPPLLQFTPASFDRIPAMFCPRCGKVNDDIGRYCQGCG